ncbi:MAG: Ig-like domain-containing protein [Firmicutes bacterium]|nr:Ig-like domain-containing protein [Bacillota bacterium]
MKRAGVIASLTILIVILSSVFSFAGSLELVSSYPEEGSKYSVVQNVMVKLEFNEEVAAESVQDANANCFTIVSETGEKIASHALYDPEKRPNEIWLLVDSVLASDTGYKVSISDSLQSTSGNTLSGDIDFSFKTRNLKTDSRINTILMFAMIAVMIVMTMMDTKRQMKKEMEKRGKVDTVDVYKEAKRTGKSVEEIVAKTEKKKENVQKKYEASKAKYEAAKEKAEAAEKAKKKASLGVKVVKERRSISAIGMSMPAAIKKERDAKEQARIKAEEARKAKEAEWKAAANKKKGSHQQQKKKK